MGIIATSIKDTFHLYTRLASRLILIAGVFLLVMALYVRLMEPPRLGLEMEIVQKQQRDEFLEILASSDKLPQEVQSAIEIQRASYCKLTGDFCHKDFSKVTQQDIDDSISTKIADSFLIPFMNMPPSGVQSTLNAMAGAGLVPKSYAASGIGLGGISAYAEVWKQMRNVAFLILVLFVLSAGFVIMFGSAINASAAVKIENILPKIIVTMIVIQFSMTIVGFLVDIMYISCAFVIAVLGPLVAPSVAQVDLINKYVYSSPHTIFTAITGPGDFMGNIYKLLYEIPDHILNILGVQMRYIFRIVIAIIGLIALAPNLERLSNMDYSAFKTLFQSLWSGGAAGKVLASLSGIVAVLYILWKALPVIIFLLFPQLVIGVILVGAIFIAAWKILKLILSAFITIILLTILSPLILVQDIMPGKSGLKPWIKGLMRELSTFPIFIAVLLISYLILSVQLTGIGLKLPFMYGIDPQAFAYIVGVSILAMSPKLIDDFKTALFGSPYNMAGEAHRSLLQGLPLVSMLPGMKTVRSMLERTAPKSNDMKKLEDLRKYFGP